MDILAHKMCHNQIFYEWNSNMRSFTCWGTEAVTQMCLCLVIFCVFFMGQKYVSRETKRVQNYWNTKRALTRFVPGGMLSKLSLV